MVRIAWSFFTLFLTVSAMAGGKPAQPQATAVDAVLRYRSMGLAGVQAAIDAGVQDRVLDRICEQHDCRASKLYWYTDLERALIESRRQKKPVLSLRLLGRLDEELSCTNSRFFRTLLYSDPQIAALMREKFILHWQSERPAPRITIDFGDGRKIVQTITGNSIHYLLDSDGKVLDALPGLYSPDGFREALAEFTKLFAGISSLQGQARQQALVAYHRAGLATLERQWQDPESTQLATQAVNLQQASKPARPSLPPVAAYAGSTGRAPARDAATLAMAKAVVEVRPIKALQPDQTTERRRLRELMDDPMWARLAQDDINEVRLSKESEALVRSKLVYYPSTGLLRTADDAQKTLAALKLAVAIDGLRNDFVYRRALHAWLGEKNVNYSLEALNRRVYESLFLTPGTDPWLGLKPEGVYTGIRGDGISVAGH